MKENTKYSGMVGSRHYVNMEKLRRMAPCRIVLGELFVLANRDDSALCPARFSTLAS
jgi:hypothetical protein